MDSLLSAVVEQQSIALAHQSGAEYSTLSTVPDAPLQRIKDAENMTQSLLVRMDEVCLSWFSPPFFCSRG